MTRWHMLFRQRIVDEMPVWEWARHIGLQEEFMDVESALMRVAAKAHRLVVLVLREEVLRYMKWVFTQYQSVSGAIGTDALVFHAKRWPKRAPIGML